MPTVYLDVCCLNRPFDDQSRARIRLEAEAVLIILAQCEADQWEWISSEVVDLEISRNPDPERRRRVQLLASCAQRTISVGTKTVARAQKLTSDCGISPFDALHLACAESGAADVFLTTDDQFLRRATSCASLIHVQVENPLQWLEEVSR